MFPVLYPNPTLPLRTKGVIRPSAISFGGPAPEQPGSQIYVRLLSVPTESFPLELDCRRFSQNRFLDSRFPIFDVSATRYDFAAFLLKRPNPLEEAHQLKKVLSKPKWDKPLGQRYWLHCLMTYPPHQLKGLIETAEAFHQMGWAQNDAEMVYSMTLIEQSLSKGLLRWNDLSTLPQKMKQAFSPRMELEEKEMAPLEDSFRYVLKTTLDAVEAQAPYRPLLPSLQDVFKELGQFRSLQQTFLKTAGVSARNFEGSPRSNGFWEAAEKAFRDQPSVTVYTSRLKRIYQQLSPHQQTPGLMNGLLEIYCSFASPEQQALLLKAIPPYLARGGSASFLISSVLPGNLWSIPLPLSNDDRKDLEHYSKKHLDELTHAIRPFKSPEEVARFEKVFSIFYGKIHQPIDTHLEWVQALTQIHSTLAPASQEAEDPHKLQSILNRGVSLAEVQQLGSDLPEILYTAPSEQALNSLLVRGVLNGGTISALKAVRHFLDMLRPAFPNTNSAEEIVRAYEPFLMAVMQTETLLPMFEDFTQTLLPLLTQQHQQGRDSSQLSSVLRDLIDWVQSDQVRLQDLPQLLSPFWELTDRLKNLRSVLYNICLTTPNRPNAPPITHERVQQLLEWLQDYQSSDTTTPNPKPLKHFFHLLSTLDDLQIPKADWRGYIQVFSQATHLSTTWPHYPDSQLLKSWSRFVQKNGLQTLQEPLLQEIMSAADLLKNQFFIVKGFGDREMLNILNIFLSNSRNLADFQHNITMLSVLLDSDQPVEMQANLLELFIQIHQPVLMQHPELLARWRHYVLHSKDAEVSHKTFFTERMFLLASSPIMASLSPKQIEKFLSHLPQENQAAGRDFIGEMAGVFLELEKTFTSQDLKVKITEMILELPDSWHKTSQFFSRNAPRLQEYAKSELSDAEMEKNLQTFVYNYFPTQLLNHVVMNLDHLHPQTLYTLYHDVEYGGEPGKEMGQRALPELMALMGPYFSLTRKKALTSAEDHWGIVSGAITRLYDYIGVGIYSLERAAIENWTRIGTTGLSFSKWQFDAMTRWKGQGPMEQKSLLEASGLFQKIPPRPNDATYHGGYFHYDEDTGVAIELRRAYMVISSPNGGALVIRNSSPVFGRDKLAEPAYYSDITWYNSLDNLFDPEDAMGDDAERNRFDSVIGVRLNKTIESQREHHGRIRFLLDAYEQLMQQYTTWKCGFEKGKPPAGFAPLLQAATQSTQAQGSGPFSTLRPTRLAWVDPFALPYPLKVFDLAEAKNQVEAAFYQSLFNQPRPIRDVAEYDTRMPKLKAFLSEGLEKGWELILTPPAAKAPFPEPPGGAG